MKSFDQHLADQIKPLLGREVSVMSKNKVLHRGVVLGNTVSGVQVGLTWTSLGLQKPVGQKYISVFYTNIKALKAV